MTHPTPALLPCPFCGGNAYEEYGDRGGKQIECESCGASMSTAGEWNRRATPSQAAQAPEAAAVEARRVFLVATGETHEGRETFTRHDTCPPLCDAETLFTQPPAQPAGEPTPARDVALSECIYELGKGEFVDLVQLPDWARIVEFARAIESRLSQPKGRV